MKNYARPTENEVKNAISTRENEALAKHPGCWLYEQGPRTHQKILRIRRNELKRAV